MGKKIDIGRPDFRTADDGEIESPLDQDIRKAIKVDIPENLPGKILLKQSLIEEQEKNRLRKNIYYVAASVLFAVVVLAVVIPDTPDIGQAVLTHAHDEFHYLNVKNDVSDARLNSLLGFWGGRLTGSIGQVNHAGLCSIRNGLGIHIFIDSQYGPVMVFMLPEENIANRTDISDGRFTGVIFPAAGGSTAVVAENPAALPGIEAKITQSIYWPG